MHGQGVREDGQAAGWTRANAVSTATVLSALKRFEDRFIYASHERMCDALVSWGKFVEINVTH